MKLKWVIVDEEMVWYFGVHTAFAKNPNSITSTDFEWLIIAYNSRSDTLFWLP